VGDAERGGFTRNPSKVPDDQRFQYAAPLRLFCFFLGFSAWRPARPIPARTPRMAWLSYTFCDPPRKHGPYLARPVRLDSPRRNCKPPALNIRIVFAHFSLVRAPSATSSPNLVARWDFGACRSCGQKSVHVLADIACWDLRSQVSSKLCRCAGEQPKLCRSAAGNPSSRSLRINGRHSDGNATAPPD
jgi:hypothetical protein